MSIGKYYVADEHKEEYTDKLVGRSVYCGTVENRKESMGIESESLVVYLDKNGKEHDISIESLEAVEEQIGKIKASE